MVERWGTGGVGNMSGGGGWEGGASTSGASLLRVSDPAVPPRHTTWHGQTSHATGMTGTEREGVGGKGWGLSGWVR